MKLAEKERGTRERRGMMYDHQKLKAAGEQERISWRGMMDVHFNKESVGLQIPK